MWIYIHSSGVAQLVPFHGVAGHYAAGNGRLVPGDQNGVGRLRNGLEVLHLGRS